MKYKIVKNELGEVVAYGPNDGMYEPSLKENETVTLVDAKDVDKVIESFHKKISAEIAAQDAAANNLKSSAITKLAALGLTEDEAKAIIG